MDEAEDGAQRDLYRSGHLTAEDQGDRHHHRPVHEVEAERHAPEVLDVIKGLVETGMTSVIVTHEMRFAKEVSDRVLFMAEGNVLEQGSPDQVFNHPTHPRLQEFLAKVL